jgi:hypothetical protein
MDELALMQVPPMVQVGQGGHSVLVHVAEHPEGVQVELRHPIAGKRGAYRVLKAGVVHDPAKVLDWIAFVAPGVGGMLDAELRADLKAKGYA